MMKDHNDEKQHKLTQHVYSRTEEARIDLPLSIGSTSSSHTVSSLLLCRKSTSLTVSTLCKPFARCYVHANDIDNNTLDGLFMAGIFL